MGIIAQIQAQALTFAPESPLGRWLQSEANRIAPADAVIPTNAAASDAVGSLADSTHTSGNLTLTIGIRQASGLIESATTANIAFDATAATVESAVDTTLTAVVTGWTNGDITVSGTAVNSGPLTFTYDGASVTGKEAPLIVLVDVDGAGGAFGATSITTTGQTERAALSMLLNYGIITGSVAAQSAENVSGTGFTKGTTDGTRIPGSLIKALMKEAAAEDANNSTYHAIEEALYGSENDRANAVEFRIPSDE